MERLSAFMLLGFICQAAFKYLGWPWYWSFVGMIVVALVVALATS